MKKDKAITYTYKMQGGNLLYSSYYMQEWLESLKGQKVYTLSCFINDYSMGEDIIDDIEHKRGYINIKTPNLGFYYKLGVNATLTPEEMKVLILARYDSQIGSLSHKISELKEKKQVILSNGVRTK